MGKILEDEFRNMFPMGNLPLLKKDCATEDQKYYARVREVPLQKSCRTTDVCYGTHINHHNVCT